MMPTYVYECPRCKTTLDLTLKVADLDELIFFCVRCDKDGQTTAMRRVMQAPLAVFPNGMKPGLTIADHKKKGKDRRG